MNNKNGNKINIIDSTMKQNEPFVNDECGDTLWDDVLKEAEKTLQKIVTHKSLEASSQSTGQNEQ